MNWRHKCVYAGMAVFVILLVLLVVLKELPAIWLPYYLAINIIAYAMYWHDKRAAVNRQWRVSEKALLTVSVAGGWLGAWFAQQQFRHKTKKTSFQLMFALSVIANVLLVLWIAVGNGAGVLQQLL